MDLLTDHLPVVDATARTIGVEAKKESRRYYDPSRGIEVGDVYELGRYVRAECIRRIKSASPFLFLITCEPFGDHPEHQTTFQYTEAGKCLLNPALDLPRQSPAHLVAKPELAQVGGA